MANECSHLNRSGIKARLPNGTAVWGTHCPSCRTGAPTDIAPPDGAAWRLVLIEGWAHWVPFVDV